MTAQGTPRAIYKRAIERGNLLVAEVTLRQEIPRPTLVDLLELTALIAFKQPERFSRVAARWLLKYLERVDDATIDEAAFAAASLGALGSRHHEHALSTLMAMAQEADRRPPRRDPRDRSNSLPLGRRVATS